ncbi:stress responsive A/B barrel domain-containing protein [Truncatella angustata]|uniref:Stress responsive A/B barrel domain-containing protein n=1 Tax=Truncatella angustata TaxID=152316 RepID=A0A9P8UQK9_9PEZI|nr:stress responsive A/B barrel domain-containing protein [Truncatella angustata]KAH6656548.1 stress responsive A/B barrel domain-containing protein [Truncatella angustata]
MAGRIHRVTMFKVPEPEDQKKLIEAYKTLNKSQQKNGKPYILSLNAGIAMDDARSQGFTVVSKTDFASLDDMKYYDDKCEAHAALKAFAKGNLKIQGGPSGVLTVYFEPTATGST